MRAHRLLFHDPGHFHAALVLRNTSPRLDRTIHVYARSGPDLNSFLALIQQFNARDEDPTDWAVELHSSDKPLEALIAERRGTLTVVAGRNAPKLEVIRQLHEAGFHVLADKPWLTSRSSLQALEQVTASPPIAMDIMTERYDSVARLRKAVVSTQEVFGKLAAGTVTAPALEFSSIHHLCKTVYGRPLRRPEWYYDIREQGDGLVDIQSHMTDQAQWLIGANADGPVVEHAERWSTRVPLALYRQSTGTEAFPGILRDRVDAGTLNLACNGAISYRFGGHFVRQRAEWRLKTPPGGGDAHSSIVRGTAAWLEIRKGPETGHNPEIRLDALDPARLARALPASLAVWQADFPGLTAEPANGGFRLHLPDALMSGHETLFPKVLDDFLDHVESRVWPETHAATIRTRYRLLAAAREVARDIDVGS